MNNILYLVNYVNNDNLCPAICYQMLNQSKECTTVSLFSSSEIRDVYYHYFMNDTNKLKFLFNTENIVKDILSTYRNFQWFVFLSPLALYDKDVTEEIHGALLKTDQQQIVFYPHNEKNNAHNFSVATNKQKFLEYSTNNEMTIRQIINTIKSSYDTKKIPLLKSVAIKNVFTEQPKICFHEDDMCMFAKFLSHNNIVESFAYLNKKNNRMYNIANNIVGSMYHKNDDYIVVEWQTDLNATVIKYWLNSSTKEYMPV